MINFFYSYFYQQILVLAKQGKISIILIPEVASDALYVCLQVLLLSLLCLYSLICNQKWQKIAKCLWNFVNWSQILIQHLHFIWIKCFLFFLILKLVYFFGRKKCLKTTVIFGIFEKYHRMRNWHPQNTPYWFWVVKIIVFHDFQILSQKVAKKIKILM